MPTNFAFSADQATKGTPLTVKNAAKKYPKILFHSFNNCFFTNPSILNFKKLVLMTLFSLKASNVSACLVAVTLHVFDSRIKL